MQSLTFNHWFEYSVEEVENQRLRMAGLTRGRALGMVDVRAEPQMQPSYTRSCMYIDVGVSLLDMSW